MTLALLAVTATAIIYGTTTIMQAIATRRSHGLSALAQPLVVAALVLDGVGWLLSLVALDRLPLFVVQAIQASSVVVVVVLARFVLGTRLRSRDGVAIAVVVGALVVLARASGEQPAITPPAGFTLAMMVASLVLAVVTVALYRRGGALVLALAGGLGYSGAAIAARGLHAADGLLETVLQPLAIPLVVCGACGALASLRALEQGAAGTISAVLSVTEVVVPGVVGVLVLGDTVRPGWALWAVLAVLAALAACTVLAMSPANRQAEDAGAGAGAAPSPMTEPTP